MSDTAAQKRPLIDKHCENQSVNDSRQYSMASNDSTTMCQKGPQRHSDPDRCLCNLFSVQVACLAIAIVEFVFLVYQISTTIWFFDKNEDSYILAISLILSSYFLALVAVVLLVIGIRRKTPYFLVPHIFMQYASVVSLGLLASYLFLLLFGGTSVDVDTIIYEDSPRGELGYSQAVEYEPMQFGGRLRGLKHILLTLLIWTTCSLACQVWFLNVVRRCYAYLHRLALDKPMLAIDNGESSKAASTKM